ncbi:MAG TPA: 4-(cytidine 5'-diphospho)-2-C-methyl-D-erythritol kinase [Xanthobacteraceae bacterium]|nr:4-(cytidine 5'-diphospho)-2-C-methyl-D-erythritol kinase [Xanthobacteraceae bacterium]
MAPLTAHAPAKVNLTLRVAARRSDGLHEIDSLVVFSDIADELSLDPLRPRGLELLGPLRAECGPVADNLVLKAAGALAARVFDLKIGHFALIKRIPVAAGLGGGSADAAAALRLLAQANGLRPDDPRLHEAARVTGADVSVCLDPRPRIMCGTGEVLSAAFKLPPLAAVLVNPAVALPTREVFDAFDALHAGPPPQAGPLQAGPPSFNARDGFLAFLQAQPNDLETAAISLRPVIGEVLSTLQDLESCRLARMSGSGATCFGLFDTEEAAASAARQLRAAHSNWWIEETTLG